MSARSVRLGTSDDPAVSADASRSTYAKVTWRLMPLLFFCYVLAYMDRINIGFAQLQMKSDLGFTDAVYGLGAGIFFLGYFLFELPSNLWLQRIGARKTITRIMVVWGLISASMASVHEPLLFYGLRFLLGVFEAGFFPGVILYLTFWYPGAYRARIIAIFSSAFAVAGLLGGVLSGWIMTDLAGLWGLKGWQLMFIFEGLPTSLVGLLVLFYLDDKPDEARWLSASEKRLVQSNVDAENVAAVQGAHSLSALRDPKVYALAFSWFCFICGIYMISFWLPTLIKDMGVSSPLHVGLLTAIPYAVSVVGMLLIGIHSDRTLERRWHLILPVWIAAVALVGLNYCQGEMVLSFALLSIASLGIFTSVPQLWVIPAGYLKGAAAAGGIAFINSLGLVGGFVSPFVLGWIRTSTGSLALGNWIVAGVVSLGGLVILMTIRPDMLRETRL